MNSPNTTKAEIVEKIIHLSKNYHVGTQKISMHLKRYDIDISDSGVWHCTRLRILRIYDKSTHTMASGFVWFSLNL